MLLLLLIIVILKWIYDDEQSINDCDKLEYYDNSEAIQNIASVYNKDNLIVNNVKSKNVVTDTVLTNNIVSDKDFSITVNEPGNLSLIGGNNITFKGSNICVGTQCVSHSVFANFISGLSKKDFMYSSNENNYVLCNNMSDYSSFPISPNGNNTLSFYGNKGLWPNGHGFVLLNINGPNVSYPAGLLCKVPLTKYGTIWIRCLNDRDTQIALYNTLGYVYGVYAGGHRRLSTLSPDGGTPNADNNNHAWMPIPLPPFPPSDSADINFVLVGKIVNTFVSGIAFSKNPWNHACISSRTAYNKLNGGNGIDTPGITEAYINNDLVIKLQSGNSPGPTPYTIHVPVIDSGKDKLVYIIEYNDPGYDGMGHGDVKIGSKKIERFRMTYINPFSQHYNSKSRNLYAAALIPASIVSEELKSNNSMFIKLTIDMTVAGTGAVPNNHLFIREFGTHDYY